MRNTALQDRQDRTGTLQILLVEDNPGDARLVEELVHEAEQTVTVRWENDLESGLGVLNMVPSPSLDVLLVDLGLPDSGGMDTVDRITRAAPHLPVVVLTGQQDLDTALASIKRGATEYLRKEELSPGLLERTIRWALERKEMAYKATHDALTELPNRVALHHKIEPLLDGSDEATTSALLFLDLDRFKRVNDSLGHSKGDVLLTCVAERLQNSVRQSDLVARLGGDEFAVCLSEMSDPERVYQVAERIHEKLSSAFTLDDREVYAPASIGVVAGLSRYDAVEDALRDADAAMYEAKDQVRKPFVVFENSLSQEIDVQLTLDAELRNAIDQGEFVPYFQPLVDHRDGTLEGVEVLARWDHPERGILSPGTFLPTAETTGLIVPLGHQVIEKACDAIGALKRTRGPDIPPTINANFSRQELFQTETHTLISRLLEEKNIASDNFVVEVTERAMDGLSSEKKAGLFDLKELGVSIVLDDFGTGFSSLQMLNDLPIDGIKLDKEFLAGAGQEKQSRVLVESVVKMAHNLDMHVTAEGIETPNQLFALRESGCEFGQGFLFSRPLPPSNLDQILDRPTWTHFWGEDS